MIALLAMFLPAAAADPPDDASWRPLRLATGVVLRRNSTTAAFLSFGIEPAQLGPAHLELTVSYTALHIFTLPGPRRTWGSLDGLVDLGFDLGQYLTTGPTVGAGLRIFSQQGTLIDQSVTGLYGWRAAMTMFRSKPIGIVMEGRVLGDTRPVELVLATSQVQQMPQLEVRFGLALVFGPRRRW
ncbi:MAG: hypothetical protein AAF211_20715 [Myxococcota bacterium]